MRCSVLLLGGFEVAVDGRAVPIDAWHGRRAVDLVKILALEPSYALHREQVMELLWPELVPDAAGANLRKAIHFARRAMGSDDAVQGESGMLSLWGGEVTVDAARFTAVADAAVAAGDAQRCGLAAQLYRGHVLPADRYEPWAAQPRARLRERYLAVLKGARQFERVLELDPTDEESHRELLRGYFESGRRREAIRQFERLRDALREFVGVGPDQETIALYEKVLAAEGPPVIESAHRTAALIATGLVHLNRTGTPQPERVRRGGAARPPGPRPCDRCRARSRSRRCEHAARPGLFVHQALARGLPAGVHRVSPAQPGNQHRHHVRREPVLRRVPPRWRRPGTRRSRVRQRAP